MPLNCSLIVKDLSQSLTLSLPHVGWMFYSPETHRALILIDCGDVTLQAWPRGGQDKP